MDSILFFCDVLYSEFSCGENAPGLKAFCLDFCRQPCSMLHCSSVFVWFFLWKPSHDNEGKRWIIGALGRGENGEFKQEEFQEAAKVSVVCALKDTIWLQGVRLSNFCWEDLVDEFLDMLNQLLAAFD